jgi:hypothetical protein
VGLEELSIEKVRFSRPALEPENALNARTYETMFVRAETLFCICQWLKLSQDNWRQPTLILIAF